MLLTNYDRHFTKKCLAILSFRIIFCEIPKFHEKCLLGLKHYGSTADEPNCDISVTASASPLKEFFIFAFFLCVFVVLIKIHAFYE